MFRDFKKYEVFEDGRIWSYVTNKFLKPHPNHKGYELVTLSDNDNNKKTYQVHRVVYEAVSGKPIPEGMQVNHIDENKTNNHISNLNLMTPKENSNWGSGIEKHTKTRSKPVAQYNMGGKLINIYPSLNEVSRTLHLSSGRISESCRGITSGYKGFRWKYLDIF